MLPTAVLMLAAVAPAADGALEEQFTARMSGVRLVGHFTVTGQPLTDLKREEYVIEKVEKLEQEDLWRFQSRIRYGDKDVSVPLELPVRWVDGTPVITLTDVWIPGMGTFSARVVLHQGKYAGTWSHGEKGGHLFGTIEPLDEQPERDVTTEGNE